jgi:hypothetical protein
MALFTLQDRFAERLREIAIPRPFCLDAFATAVAERRSRPLRILPLVGLDGSDGLSGAWAATDTTDYVLIDADASPWHRDLIGLHEIGHILCGHTRPHGRAGNSQAGHGDVAVPRALGPSCGSSRDEEEAELTAFLVLERAEADPLPASSPGGTADLRAVRSLRLELAAAVPPAASPWGQGTALPEGGSRIRLIQATAEIRDAVLALRSYIPATVVAQSRRALAALGLTGTALDAAVGACWLELAVRAARAGRPATAAAHVLPGGSTLREEVRWLGQVGAAMRSPRVQAVAGELAGQLRLQPA